MSTTTTETHTPTVEELQALVDEPAGCDLLCPPEGAKGIAGWAGEGVPCGQPAVARWKLICPSHGPVELWVCAEHVQEIYGGKYAFMCGTDYMRWEPA